MGKVLTIDVDKDGKPLGGVNFKISSKVPITKDKKTLSLMLPGKAGKPSKYLLRYKSPTEADAVHAAVAKHQK